MYTIECSISQATKLTGRLAEFRTALEREIDASRRHEASTAVPLVNGRRVSSIGASFQYVFEAENVLNLPGDAPGDLILTSDQRIPCEVIAVNGMVITIRITEDLGAFVASARLQSNMAHLMLKLIERIEGFADAEHPVADRILNPSLITGSPVAIKLQKCNPEQERAVASSLGHTATFLWGPPGTGKTRTIGIIGKELYRREHSVLLVSHTNTAVDQALIAIKEDVPNADLIAGRVIRVGDPPNESPLSEYPELLARTHVERRSADLITRKDTFIQERDAGINRLQHLIREIALWEWVQDAHTDIAEMTASYQALLVQEDALTHARVTLAQLNDAAPYWAKAAEASRRTNSILAQIEKLRPQLATAQAQYATALKACAAAQGQYAAAAALLTEVKAMGWLKRTWNRLPSPEEQQSVVERCQARLRQCQSSLDTHHGTVTKIEQALQERAAYVEAFKREYGGLPDGILRQAAAHAAELQRVTEEIKRLTGQCDTARAMLTDLLRSRTAALREWGLFAFDAQSLPDMLTAIQTAYQRAATAVQEFDIIALRQAHTALNNRIRDIDTELEQIEEQLKRVEEIVIANATIVATTLTRAYLRNSIQARRFHTVILDEASMAPIPALWVAACLAEANAVVTGDPLQLPPIVISDHPMACKWLGHDIFSVAGIERKSPEKPYLVMLKEQFRMHPLISAIPNALIYEDQLRDGQNVTASDADDSLDQWYQREWGYDHPVLLVDTGSLNAWVTSVANGVRSSRLNFLSATVCADIAELLLREKREPSNGKPRILIANPYRPHAELLKLLLKEQDLDRDVTAGTAHNFQGAEADVVIFDLVNDEPHWKVNLFIPSQDETNRRLLNVALSRAKRRLIVVGDFTYNVRTSRRAFLGNKLLPFLLGNYPKVDAREILPVGFATRAAQTQSRIFGGHEDSRIQRLITTQDRFFPLLYQDLLQARRRIIIFSAFMTQERISTLSPQLQAALERGVQVFIVTKSLEERGRGDRGLYRTLEQTLKSWGVTIIHKRAMHEKLVIIDEDILWTGSLNPLSFRNTQEIMERRGSKAVVQEYEHALRLDELTGEYIDGQPTCPICRGEMVASEGTNTPYFWRCVVDGCYSRDIDEPRIDGGIIRCKRCGEPAIYGQWGDKPAWRCHRDRQYHQNIVASHLRLPAMRAVIPPKELRRLEQFFGVSFEPCDGQQSLFT